MKKIILYILFINIATSQINIKIYNQGLAFIQEERSNDLFNINKQSLQIKPLPHSIIPSSINLLSNDIEFLSIEYIYHPINIKNLLNHNLGNEIELVKYGENGKIIYSTKGKLLSNTDIPIFEINNKIVLDPPYEYIFNNIPNNINDHPYINCNVNGYSKNSKYNLSYLTEGLYWQAEYNLYLISDNKSSIEGWYSIHNNNNINYKSTNLSLVSGKININKQNSKFDVSNKAAAFRNTQNFKKPEINKVQEYFIYNIPNKITLLKKSQYRYKFLNKDNLKHNITYHVSHNLTRHHWKTPSQTSNIPVNTELELSASEISDFQMPAGIYNMYNKNENQLTFLGSDSYNIIEGDDKIKLKIGKSHDIICTFTTNGFKINKNSGKAQVSAIFHNKKNKPVTIKWIEKLSDGRWEIIDTKQDFTRIDAFHIEFIITIPAQSKKEVSFYAKMEKE